MAGSLILILVMILAGLLLNAYSSLRHYKNVKDGMAGFVRDAEQFDDTTMLCIRFNGME